MSGAAIASAAPSILSALQGQKGSTPVYYPTMTPAQYAQLQQMVGTSSRLTPLQGNTLEYMMQGGTAGDYGQGALNTYYQNTLADPAMQELYNETLPSIGNRLQSKYWQSITPREQQMAEQATSTQLGKQYGELAMANELAQRTAQEEARTSGLSLLGQMQGQTLSAKPFDIVMQTKPQKGFLAELISGHKGSLIGSNLPITGEPFGGVVMGGVGGSLLTKEKWA